MKDLPPAGSREREGFPQPFMQQHPCSPPVTSSSSSSACLHHTARSRSLVHRSIALRIHKHLFGHIDSSKMASFTANRLQSQVAQERKALASARPAAPSAVVRAPVAAAAALSAAANVVSPMHGDAASIGASPGRKGPRNDLRLSPCGAVWPTMRISPLFSPRPRRSPRPLARRASTPSAT